MKRGKNMMAFVIITVAVIAILFAYNYSRGNVDTKSSESSVNETNKNVNKFETISAQKGKEMLDSNKNITLVDVRTEAEYKEKHIPQSVLIPLDVIKDEAPKILKDKDAVILVYCRSGNRSKTAASILASLGYSKVYDMGGINSWPYETEK